MFSTVFNVKIFDGTTGAYLYTYNNIVLGGFSKIINSGLGECNCSIAIPLNEFSANSNVIKLLNKVIIEIVDVYTPPEGVIVYSGYISKINPSWDTQGSHVNITILGYATDLTTDIMEQSSREIVIPRAIKKTSDNAKYFIDLYRASRSIMATESTGTRNGHYHFGLTTYIAESFTVSSGKTKIAKVTIPIIYSTGTGDTITCRIETDNSNKPSGTLVDTNATVTSQAAIADTVVDFMEFVFPVSFTLVADTKYWIVFQSSSSSSVLVYEISQNSAYSNGNAAASTNSGSTWTDLSSNYLDFKVYYIDENICPIKYTTASVEDSGDSMTYSFAGITYKDALDQNLRLAYTSDRNWYWYIDENNVFYFKKAATTATHTFTWGKDLTHLNSEKTIEGLKNRIMIWNMKTAGDKVFVMYKDNTSINSYWRRTTKLIENRVATTTESQAIGDSFLQLNKDPNIKSTFKISASQFDIKSIKPGDTCRIINLPTELVNMFNTNMMIRRITYEPDLKSCELEIEDLQPNISDSLRDLEKQFIGLSNEDIPTVYNIP